MNKASYFDNLFAKKYQLENNLRPFNGRRYKNYRRTVMAYMPCGYPMK